MVKYSGTSRPASSPTFFIIVLFTVISLCFTNNQRFDLPPICLTCFSSKLSSLLLSTRHSANVSPCLKPKISFKYSCYHHLWVLQLLTFPLGVLTDMYETSQVNMAYQNSWAKASTTTFSPSVQNALNSYLQLRVKVKDWASREME